MAAAAPARISAMNNARELVGGLFFLCSCCCVRVVGSCVVLQKDLDVRVFLDEDKEKKIKEETKKRVWVSLSFFPSSWLIQ